MGLWSKLTGGDRKSAAPPPPPSASMAPVVTTMGIAGHGMLLAPACPCRVVQMDNLLIIGRGYNGRLLTEAVITVGTAPASEKPKRIADHVWPEAGRPADHLYALGASGPTIAFEGVGPKLADMFASIDVGLGVGPDAWTVLAPGFMFALPTPGFALYSPDPTIDGDLPELHIASRTSASISFRRSARAVDAVEVKGPNGQLTPHDLDLGDGAVARRWELHYVHDGEPWIQHTYALGLATDRTIMMIAQAPEAIWPQMAAAAMTVARTLQPLS